MNIYGKSMDKTELLMHVGAMRQIMGAREATFFGGRQEGVKAVEVYNDTGLTFTVLPGKGMEISHAAFCGKALSWDCKNGVVHPAYFENGGTGFFRSFSGGLLTACGLLNAGGEQREGEVVYGLHDRIGNIPAERYTVEEAWEGGEYLVRVKGTVRQSGLYYENLTLTREITCKLGEPRIWIADVIRNEGFVDTEFMYMYHMNFGYPLLCAETKLYSPAEKVRDLDDKMAQRAEDYAAFCAPQKGYAFKCYAHDMPARERVAAALINPGLELGAYVAYSPKELPTFNTWKMMGPQDYVMGLEPGLNVPEGRQAARENGRLRVLKAQEEFRCGLEIGVISGRDEIELFIEQNFQGRF